VVRFSTPQSEQQEQNRLAATQDIAREREARTQRGKTYGKIYLQERLSEEEKEQGTALEQARAGSTAKTTKEEPVHIDLAPPPPAKGDASKAIDIPI
jgi:hypothetical protein